jgi:hypothetical protein
MKALSLLHRTLKNSPKIRTEMIRNKMFDILLVILLGKIRLFTNSIILELRTCIAWNRYNIVILIYSTHDIAYPDAFRRVFLHLDLWKVDKYLQLAIIHVHQSFFSLAPSPSKEINMKNVFNQSCIKRLIAIYSENIIHEIHIWTYSQLLKRYLRGSFDIESLRAIWSFLLSTLPKHDEKTDEFCMTFSSDSIPISEATRKILKIRNSILIVLLDIICEDTSLLQVFVHGVSFRWILLFCGPYLNPVTVYLALKILRLMKSDATVAESLNESGYEVLSRSMERYHDIVPIYVLLLDMLFGKAESQLPENYQFNTPTLLALFKPSDTSSSNMSGGAILPIIRLIKASSEHILNNKDSEQQSFKFFSGVSWTEKGLVITEYIEERPLFTATKNCCALLEFMSHMFQINEFKELICEEDVMSHFLDILFSLLHVDNTKSSTSLKSGSLETLCNNLKDAFFELLVTILCDSLMGDWAPWRAIEVVLKAIPTPVHEELFNFQSILIGKILEEIPNKLRSRKGYLGDSAVLNSIAKFFEVIMDRIFADLYNGDIFQFFDLNIAIIKDLLSAENRSVFSVVLRSDLSIQNFWKQLNRLVLHMFRKIMNEDGAFEHDQIRSVLKEHAEVIFGQKNTDIVFLKCSLYYLFTSTLVNRKLDDISHQILHVLLQERSVQITTVIKSFNIPETVNLLEILKKISVDSEITGEDFDILTDFSEKLKEDWDSVCDAEEKLRISNLKLISTFKSERRSTLSSNRNNERSLWISYSKQAESLLLAAKNSLKTRQKITAQDISAFHISRTADWQKIVEELARERSIWGSDVAQKAYWRLGTF